MIAHLQMAEELRKHDLADALVVATLGARGDGREIARRLKEWSGE